MKYSISFLALLVAFSALPFTSFAQSSASDVTPRPAGPSSTIIGDQNPVLGDGKSPLEKRIESLKPFMTSPQNGQSFKSLDTMNISWTPQSDKKVRFNVRIEPIASSTKYKARNIATNVSGSGTKWKIPRNVPAGDYKISLIQNARLNGKNIPITLGKATVGINKVETNNPTAGRVLFSIANTASSSFAYTTSAQDGTTQFVHALFDIDAHVVGGRVSDLDITRDLGHVYFDAVGNANPDVVQAESSSRTRTPNKPFYEDGEIVRVSVHAVLPGNNPNLISGFYRAVLPGVTLTAGPTVDLNTNFVDVLKGASPVMQSSGWLNAITASAVNAYDNLFSIMFGWIR
jgi:hypothetical protein